MESQLALADLLPARDSRHEMNFAVRCERQIIGVVVDLAIDRHRQTVEHLRGQPGKSSDKLSNQFVDARSVDVQHIESSRSR